MLRLVGFDNMQPRQKERLVFILHSIHTSQMKKVTHMIVVSFVKFIAEEDVFVKSLNVLLIRMEKRAHSREKSEKVYVKKTLSYHHYRHNSSGQLPIGNS
jgi:hypothetical protein